MKEDDIKLQKEEKQEEKISNNTKDQAPNEDEEDQLDSFFKSIQNKATKDINEILNHDTLKQQKNKVQKFFVDDQDGLEHFNKKAIAEMKGQSMLKTRKYTTREQAENQQDDTKNSQFLDQFGNIDYNAIKQHKKQAIQPLPPVDHSSIYHDDIRFNFYPDALLRAYNHQNIVSLRKKLAIKTRGSKVPPPFQHFKELFPHVDQVISARIRHEKYQSPTPVQSQAIPCGMLGRDLIAVAKTGSGKTLAFLIPILTHILDQRLLDKGQGPIGLVLAPTRELAVQIQQYFNKFCRKLQIRVICLVGGGDKSEQWKDIRKGFEIVVSTPGRLIDMLRKKAFNLWSRCSIVAIDQADVMFNMGFEYQVRIVLGQVRPDRQVLLFSATFKDKVEKFCKDLLNEPIKINVGETGVVRCKFVSIEFRRIRILLSQLQQYKMLNKRLFGSPIQSDLCQVMAKYWFLLTRLSQQRQWPKELIKFIQCIQVNHQINIYCNFNSVVEQLHGDLLHHERLQVIQKFRSDKSNCRVLVSTNVASRGIDIPTIQSVINYDAPKDDNDYIHRIGRTGRAGNLQGVAYTLLTKQESRAAGMLVKNLQSSGQAVPPELQSLAMMDPKFHQTRMTLGIKGFNMKFNLKREQVFKINCVIHVIRSKKIGALAKRSQTKAGIGYKQGSSSKEEQGQKVEEKLESNATMHKPAKKHLYPWQLAKMQMPTEQQPPKTTPNSTQNYNNNSNWSMRFNQDEDDDGEFISQTNNNKVEQFQRPISGSLFSNNSPQISSQQQRSNFGYKDEIKSIQQKMFIGGFVSGGASDAIEKKSKPTVTLYNQSGEAVVKQVSSSKQKGSDYSSSSKAYYELDDQWKQDYKSKRSNWDRAS